MHMIIEYSKTKQQADVSHSHNMFNFVKLQTIWQFRDITVSSLVQ